MIPAILAVCAGAWAGPYRSPPVRPAAVVWEPGRETDVLVVKLAEDAGLRVEADPVAGVRVDGAGDLVALRAALAGARPLFHRDPAAIRADKRAHDPGGALADLTLYLRLEHPDAADIGTALLADPRVETAYLAFAPVEPPWAPAPSDTPDFSDLQGYMDAAPEGIDARYAWTWPGGTGDNVAVADLEYSWDPGHEDLLHTAGASAWGRDTGAYQYHGTAVLGMLVAADNGYGVTGMVPDAEPLVVHPNPISGGYDVAAAIDGATALLDAGDVLLIEQQAWGGDGGYAPVEVDPAVFDAITLAVAKGIVVVEPSGNGAQDLDGPAFDGWFDRDARDSGAIMVGGAHSPDSWGTPRTWSQGSCYGSRIDLQGWYDGIVTASTDYGDLYWPGNDNSVAYRSDFGGTSGASPMVTAAVAIANSVAWEVRGQPWDPLDLRAALVATGTPQPSADGAELGPQPDLRRFLWTWGVR